MGQNKKMQGKCSFQHFGAFRLFQHMASSHASVLNKYWYKCISYQFKMFQLIPRLYALWEFLLKLRRITETSVLFQAFRCADGNRISYVNEWLPTIGHGHQELGQSSSACSDDSNEQTKSNIIYQITSALSTNSRSLITWLSSSQLFLFFGSSLDTPHRFSF